MMTLASRPVWWKLSRKNISIFIQEIAFENVVYKMWVIFFSLALKAMFVFIYIYIYMHMHVIILYEGGIRKYLRALAAG